MNIVLYNQFFWPDQAATSQLLTDLARGLAREGHHVTVVCGAPGYAGVDAGVAPDVTILSSRTLPFARGVVARLGSYLSYLTSAAWRTVTMKRPDVVITMTTPPLLSLLGNLAKLLRGAHHVVWEMDVYPEVAFDVGMMRRDSLIGRVLTAISHRSRRYADDVWVLGECMRQRVLAAGCRPERVHVHENWSDDDLYQGPGQGQPGALTMLYSGNLGITHDVDTTCDALLALRHEPSIQLQFAGGGPRRPALEAFVAAHDLANVAFLPYCSKRELGRVLSAADVGLVTLRDGCEGAVVPSKVYGLMACGRAVVFVGPAAATPAAVIERYGCGWRVACGDGAGLAALLRKLANDPELVRAAGARGRAAFLAHYERDRSVTRLCRALDGVAAQRGVSAPVTT